MIGLSLSLAATANRRSRPSVLVSSYESIFGAVNILGLRIANDWTPNALGKIPQLSARYGAAGTALGGELATLSTHLGFPCAVWTAGATSCYYSDVAGSLCNIAVCQYDGALPFPGYGAVLWDTGTNPIYEGSGTSNWAGGAAFYRDGAATRAADNSTHALFSDAATSPGTGGNTVASAGVGNAKFVGKIFHTARLAVRPSAPQYAALYAALQRMYPFLP